MAEEYDIIEEKQNYLRKNIIDQGYDPATFEEYLLKLKGEEGLDIENWSKNDLIKVVQDFKNQERNVNLKEKNKNLDDDNNQASNCKFKENNHNRKEDNENEEKFNEKNKNEIGSDYIECQVSESTDISLENDIEIIISNPLLVDGGFFSKSYITYLVQVKPFNFEVRRRFSDFTWLHDIIHKLYINCAIPPIICSNYHLDIKEYNRVEKRINLIKRFMTRLINHPLIRNSQILYDFISIKKEKLFENKRSTYDNLLPPSKAEEIKTNNGLLNISISEGKEKYAENIEAFSKNFESLLKKINTEYKILNTQKESIILKMKDIIILWDELYKFGTKYYEPEVKLSTYDSLCAFLGDWIELEKNQIKLTNIKIRENFRYIKNEYKSLLGNKKIVDTLKYQYYKSYKNLIDKKEKYFHSYDIEYWGLSKEDMKNKEYLIKDKKLAMTKMFPEETKKLMIIRKCMEAI